MVADFGVRFLIELSSYLEDVCPKKKKKKKGKKKKREDKNNVNYFLSSVGSVTTCQQIHTNWHNSLKTAEELFHVL